MKENWSQKYRLKKKVCHYEKPDISLKMVNKRVSDLTDAGVNVEKLSWRHMYMYIHAKPGRD